MEWALDRLPPALLRPFVMGFLTTALAPSPQLFAQGALLVNRDGRRFCEELKAPALALPDQPAKLGYILIDGKLARQFSAWPHFISTAPGVAYAYVEDYRRSRPDVYTQAPSLPELAHRLGMNAPALQDAIAEHNAALAAARGKPARSPLVDAPFIALGPVRSVFVHNEGGLEVDDQHRVLGKRRKPIAGLYAAGATGQGGLLLKGHGHHLAWAFVSGRRAGRFAANANAG
jgi:fumarate reductase flavoprotein subunit